MFSSKAIKSTYVVPVYHDGHLYGMNNKIFTCVDAATGETVWRDRQPGDGFPTLAMTVGELAQVYSGLVRRKDED